MAEHVIPAAASFGPRVSTTGPAATRALAERAADLLRGGEIILLYGALGAGKTCFVQGLCRGLGVVDEVVSPTFTLVSTYRGRLTVHHLDFYRVEARADLADIGVPEILDEVWQGDAVLVAEWPDPLVPALGLTTPRLELLATPGANPDERWWHLGGRPSPGADWRDLFAAAPPAEGGSPC